MSKIGDKVYTFERGRRRFVCPYKYGDYYACLFDSITGREVVELANDITKRREYNLNDFNFVKVQFSGRIVRRDISELPKPIKDKILKDIAI